MQNRNLFILLVIICILAPGIYFFIAGKDSEHSMLRNALVGVQVVGGIILLIIFGRKPVKK